MRRALCYLLVLAAASALVGCADPKPDDPNRVSTIPWDRPEKWEGQGPLGGMTPGTR